jgi:flagellar FliL protein
VSSTPETVEAVKPPRVSKKLLLIILGAVVLLALAGGAAWYFLFARHVVVVEGDIEEVVEKVVNKGPPSFLPLDTMVMNLADPGGERIVQVGITLELSDPKAADLVKQYLPKIRSTILLKLSERTSQEVLQREGKAKLAADILEEAQSIFPEVDSKDKNNDAHLQKPILKVLFTSFIVQ